MFKSIIICKQLSDKHVIGYIFSTLKKNLFGVHIRTSTDYNISSGQDSPSLLLNITKLYVFIILIIQSIIIGDYLKDMYMEEFIHYECKIMPICIIVVRPIRFQGWQIIYFYIESRAPERVNVGSSESCCDRYGNILPIQIIGLFFLSIASLILSPIFVMDSCFRGLSWHSLFSEIVPSPPNNH